MSTTPHTATRASAATASTASVAPQLATHGDATRPPQSRPPLSRAAQLGAAASLVLAGLLNGGAQFVGHLVIGDLDFSEQIRWGAEHPGFQLAEQTALLTSMLFLPLAALGLAQVARHRAPRLTAAGVVLTLWGFWGFHNVAALGYTSGTIAPGALGVETAVRLNDALVEHPGAVATALLPHLLGSLLGLTLLAVAGWRGRSLPRIPLALLVAFLVWDFLLPPVGPLEAHLLLTVSFVWLGIHVARLPWPEWSGAARRGPGTY